ncbi:MAG TPA: LamG-like jellyroll fold domain-containing protein [Sedimentisphaerales bacterium]|nr:LamG-like jellyroll fold domain-containing protein [Sedimentisphaerales bacterium]
MSRQTIYFISLVLMSGFFLTSSTNAIDISDPDLVGYWAFNEGSGTVAADLSENSYDGTLNGGVSWTDGIYQNALHFNGNDAYVSTGQSILNDLEGFTLAGWVSASNVDVYSSLFGQNDLVEFGFIGGSEIATWLLGNNWVLVSASYPFDYPSWHHVALTGDSTGVVIYIDGQEAASDPGAVSSGSAGFTFNIGANVFNASGDPFLGEIDDVWVFGRALTQDEIQTLMQGSGGYPYAMSPDPADGAMHAETWVTLSWRPGDFAVSHDVYLGDNFDDVNDGLGDTFRGNLGDAYFVAGFSVYPFPEGFVPGTTYYWRIDEVNDADPNSPWKGPVWSFWVPSKKAYNVSPEDGTMFIDPNVTLSWMAGFGSVLHTVYFGDDFDTVNNATGGSSQGLVGYNPGPLELNKTYYWRVDEFDRDNIYKGDVLSFTTTIPGLGEVVMERWENIPGDDVPSLTNSSKYPNNPDVTEVLTQFSWDQDLEDYGGRIHGWLYAPGTGDFTFWLCADNNGELWLSTDDDSTNVRLIARESNYSNPNTWGTGEEQSEHIPLVAGKKYYIMALWKEGTGGDQCQVAWQGPGVPTLTIIPGSNLSPYEPLNAYGAKPTNAAAGVTQTPVLEWKPGLKAVSHEVYFGTDQEAVRNATKASPEYKGAKSLGDESYDPGKLAWESTYYWRIDEVNSINPDSPWVGSVWSFTTADFLIIDDFESYDAGDNQMWYSWHDGLGYGVPGVDPFFGGNGTGAAIGDDTTLTYTEQNIVHGGAQSMPYWYNNNKQGYAYSSEAEKKLTEARDWTEQGVAELSLWFRGYPASVGSFVEGSAATYTMTGSGADIWAVDGEEADQFHFAFKMLTGVGSIVARVQSVENTNAWAKAGVMIRETLDPDSAHAMMAVTPASGISFQRRPGTGVTSIDDTTSGITAPYWVKIERDLAGNFSAYSSADGSAWQKLGVSESIQMGSNVYIGLALTSHDAALTCEAVFTNVTFTGTVSPQWTNQDIGIASNDAEPLYVAVSNSAGAPAVVVHDDPAAAQIDTWTEWVIPLQVFADEGINLADVDRIAIGLGTKGNMTIPGGSGKMYFDDIRLYRPRESAEE